MDVRAKFSTSVAVFGAALLMLAMVLVAVASPASAADPDDWTYASGSCDTNVGGIGDDFSGVTVDGNGEIWAVENGNGTLLQVTGGGITNSVSDVPDPNGVLTGYDTEGVTWITGNFFAVAWEKNPGDTVESGMTIVEVVGGSVVEVATVSLPGISNGTGNKGLEGIAYAPAESSAAAWVFYGVKEEPAQLYRIVYDVATMTATSTLQGSIAELANLDAAGIAMDPTDSAKVYVLSDDGKSVTEVNLSDGSAVASAGALDLSTAGGCFNQPEGLAVAPGAGNTLDLLVVGEPAELVRFEITYSSLVTVPAGCGIGGCASVDEVSLGAISSPVSDHGSSAGLVRASLGLAFVTAAVVLVNRKRTAR